MKAASILSVADVSSKEINALIALAIEMKRNPGHYASSLKGKTLLMFFEKPSLRTRVSFDAGMNQLGGHSVVVDVSHTPFGAKESVEDTAKVCSRYADAIMARLFSHEMLFRLQKAASIPVINGLTDDEHPVQILSDLLTVFEKKGALKGLKLCYLGDGDNNVTYSLLLGCAIAGMDIAIGCPKGLQPKKGVVEKAKKLSSGSIVVTSDAKEAIKGADIVYTDSWMSYHIPPSQKKPRLKMLMPYQVSSELMSSANKTAIFMHCLPATRGEEQTAEVIDGRQSVVFDQAENRLHMQKAILYTLLTKN